MKPIILVPLIALALAGGSAGAYFWLSSEGSVEEAVIAQATPTPTPAATSQETPSILAAPAEESQLTPPAQTPAVPDDWATYLDAELGFSFPHAPGLTSSEDFPHDAKRIVLRDTFGVVAFSVVASPNPDGLTLEEWIKTVPGWPTEPPDWLPSEPEAIAIGGETGLLFRIDQVGQPNPTVYFGHGDYIFSVRANFGVKGSPLNEADFQHVVDGFTFGP